MQGSEQIDLAHAPSFSIGTIDVLPSTREVVGSDGTREVIEPRVMQVLVALARADGAIVSREDLTRSCWEGRIVGEDAINRVISRLRRVAQGIAADSFRIETVTKVGYRLTRATAAPADVRPQADVDEHPSPPPARRRLVIGGVAAVAVIGAGGLWAALQRPTPKPLPPMAAQLMQQGLTALRQTTGEGNAQALGLFRQVTLLAPGHADGWGALALTYAIQSHYRAPDEARTLLMQAESAADRAHAIDPDNVYATNARRGAQAAVGRWADAERTQRAGVAARPDDDLLLTLLSVTLANVGRMREASLLLDHAVEVAPPSPLLMYRRVIWQWSANRLDDAEAGLKQARELFPLHFALWFARFFIDMFAGRVGQAIAFAEDLDRRPPGISAKDIGRVVAIARAIGDDDQAQIDRVLADHFAAAHLGTGYAENAFHFAAHTGRADMAFAIADAYFFDRGFKVPARRFASGQGTYTGLADRRTWLLFQPPVVGLWRDPRFDRLLGDIGLKRYWTASGSTPDYRAG